MGLVDLLGYFAALIIGLVLGLIGGGGSILTVPVLVYLLHIDPILATAYSLFIVGTTSLAGAIKNARSKMLDYKTAIIFAIPAFVAVYISRKYIVPSIPEQLFKIGDYSLMKSEGIMIFFAIIMLLASISMIRNKKKEEGEEKPVSYNYPLITLEGLLVGLVTGIVGAGGGFLIIPALVLLANLPMKKAVATSLLIISIKSLIGFVGDVENLEIEWAFLLLFSTISIIGIFIGIWTSKFINGKKLKKAFGWFVLVMGIYILLTEIMFPV